MVGYFSLAILTSPLPPPAPAAPPPAFAAIARPAVASLPPEQHTAPSQAAPSPAPPESSQTNITKYVITLYDLLFGVLFRRMLPFEACGGA